MAISRFFEFLELVTDLADYKFIARQNCSLSSGNRVFLFAAIFLLLTTISVGFLLAGAWLVLPFAGLEVLVLGIALCAVGKHQNDFERITISGDALKVELQHKEKLNTFEFNCYWARVILNRTSSGNNSRLWIRSHGKQLELGRLLDNDSRLELAGRLIEETAAFRV